MDIISDERLQEIRVECVSNSLVFAKLRCMTMFKNLDSIVTLEKRVRRVENDGSELHT